MRAIVTGGPEVRLTRALRPLANRGRELPLIDGRVGNFKPDEIALLKRQGFRVEPDEEYFVPPLPEPIRPADARYPDELDPALPGPMRQMLDSQVMAARAAGRTGKGVLIGIADTGVDLTHPDLFADFSEWVDFAWADFVGGSLEPVDPHGHGTACAGIALGRGNIIEKFGGVAQEADFSMARVLAANGYGRASRIIEGLGWLANQGCDIISVSIQSQNPNYNSMSRALDNLVALGIVVCVCAGNYGPENRICAPANAHGAICCAACNWDGRYADFSSVGPGIGADGKELAVPHIMGWGQNVSLCRAAGTSMGTVIHDYYVAAAGTSFATPFVAGCAALRLQKEQRPSECRTALLESAYDSEEWTEYQEGHGAVRVLDAIEGDYEPEPIPKPPKSTLCTTAGIGSSVPVF